jgi:hypothetical protein
MALARNRDQRPATALNLVKVPIHLEAPPDLFGEPAVEVLDHRMPWPLS